MTLRALARGGIPAAISPVTANNTIIAAISGWSFIPVRNATGAALTVKLPATPAPNQIVSILDELGNAGTHSITINGNGKNIYAYGASAANLIINANAGAASPLVWDAITGLWALFGGM